MNKIFTIITTLIVLYFMLYSGYKLYQYFQPDVEIIQNTTPEDSCGLIGDLAVVFMLNRQSNVPIETVRETYMKSKPSENLAYIVEHMLQKAYTYPIVEDKDRAMYEFGATMMNSCNHALNGEFFPI